MYKINVIQFSGESDFDEKAREVVYDNIKKQMIQDLVGLFGSYTDVIKKFHQENTFKYYHPINVYEQKLTLGQRIDKEINDKVEEELRKRKQREQEEIDRWNEISQGNALISIMFGG